jgi:YrhK-like protein
MAINWATRRLERGPTLRIGLGFAIGSVCFLVGPFPGFVELVGAEVDAVVFFVGSLFFTAAALEQAQQSDGADRLPSLIQFAGTIYFNVDTFRAMQAAFSDTQTDRLIWAPEAIGSACFLLSAVIAYRSVRDAGHAGRSSTEWQIAAINLGGCVLFAISSVASYVVPKTGDALDLAAANWTTGLGALCFLIGSVLLVRQRPS